MKKVGMFIVVVCMLTGIFWGHLDIRVFAAETLKITRDQFEFRDEPRVADETLLGTLRIGTPVEWTGETSGGWFRVTAPNGQTGWVHESGLSKPTTRVQPTPKPASQTSRTISAPASSSQPQLQATVRELQQRNKQYQATLEEKNKRIAQLTEDIEELEAKLTDVAQMIDDQEQLYKVDQIKTTELQNELAALQETIKQKDEELLATELERNNLTNKIIELQTQTSTETGQERFWLYAISLPLNLIGLFVLGFWGIRHIRQKKSEEALLEASIRERQESEVVQKEPEEPEEEEIIIPPVPSAQKEAAKEHLLESDLEELDVVMAASSGAESVSEPEESTETEEALVDEDVVIDLADVLPTNEESSLKATIQGKEEIEILTDDLEVEELAGITSEEIVEMETAEELQHIDETPVIQEPEEQEAIEIFPEEAESIATGQEEFDHIVVIENHKTQEELHEDIEQEPAPEIEPEEIEKIPDDDMEALLENTPEMLQDTSIEELLEEGELEEEELSTAEESENLPEPEVAEEVEIEGERFEMLLERNTQIIEPEEEEAFEETLYYQETDIEEEEIPQSTLKEEVYARKIGDLEKVTTFDDIAVSSAPEESFEAVDEELKVSFEPEKEDTISDEETVKTVSEEQETEEEMLLDSLPSFLEPTPVLIEPEYEPEESSFVLTGQGPETETSAAEPSKEPRYDIELVDAGKSPEHIIHILSKIEGLTKSPRELVEQTPCIIARGAKETDAKNFQVVMKKFGSDVRLIKKT